MLLLTTFSCAGLLMAATGLFGVISYSVQQRRQEFGIRRALGEQASNLRNMVLRRGLALVLIGATVGIGVSSWLIRFLASFFYGVTALDPVTFTVTPLLLIAVALLSVWIPPRRATRVDPMAALRVD